MSKIPPPQKSQNAKGQTKQIKIILSACFMIGIVISILPQESVNGNLVPTVIFKGHPSTFHAFVICTIFSFSGSFCYLMIENKHKLNIAKFCRYCSMISMALALSIVFYALVLDGFNWVPPAKQIMEEQK